MRTRRRFCGDFLRGNDGVGMDADGVFDAAGIAASERRDDGDVAVTGGLEDPLVASLEAGLCQAQATELVFTKRIGPANVEKNIGAKFVERSFYCRQENCQVFLVSHAIVEAEIEIGRGFVSRIVIFLMDGKREDGIVLAKNMGSAVAVVDVGIHDYGFLDQAIGLQTPDSHRYIMDSAETFAVIGVSVVETAGEIARETVAQCEVAGKNGATRGEPHGFGKFGRIRNFQFHDFAGGQGTVFQFADPFLRMDAEEVLVGGACRLHDVIGRGDLFAEQKFIEQAEFLRGENVGAEIEVVTGMVDDFEGEHFGQTTFYKWLRSGASKGQRSKKQIPRAKTTLGMTDLASSGG